MLKMAIVKIVQGRLDTSRWAVVSLVELTTVEYVSTAYASPLLDNGKEFESLPFTLPRKDCRLPDNWQVVQLLKSRKPIEMAC